MDITAGGDFLGHCDQKISYKHVSDFGRLRSYGHFLIPVHALVWTGSRNQLAGDVLNLVAYRLRCKHYFCHLTRPPIYRQSSFRISTLGRYLRTVGKVGWVGIRLASVYCMTQILLRVQKPLVRKRFPHVVPKTDQKDKQWITWTLEHVVLPCNGTCCK